MPYLNSIGNTGSFLKTIPNLIPALIDENEFSGKLQLLRQVEEESSSFTEMENPEYDRISKTRSRNYKPVKI